MIKSVTFAPFFQSTLMVKRKIVNSTKTTTMKFLLLSLYLGAFGSSDALAQKLSYDELIKIHSQEFITTNDDLLEAGWQLDEAKESKNANEVGWAFKEDNGNLIIAYLSMLDSKINPKTLVYTTFSSKIYQEFKQKIVDLQMTEHGIKDNILYSVYKSEKLTFVLQISPERSIGENIYSISVMRSEDYTPTTRK
jgi:hypothetical protein